MTLKLFRFVRGYVDFKITGKFPERLMNITSRYGVQMWSAAPCSGGITASMYLSDYRKIRFFTQKARLKTRVTARHGIPFIISRYKNRLGLPVGLISGLTAMMLLSCFAWTVQIVGTERISDTKLIRVLGDCGVKAGVLRKSFDVQSVQRAVMLKIPEISWMSINITGSVVTVEIKEKTDKPKINDTETPCNVTAKSDGVITEMNVLNGMSKVKTGSGVAQGELLVSGIVETKRDTIRYLHAQAQVLADVKYSKSLALSKEYSYEQLGRQSSSKKKLKLFWLEFPCSISLSGFSSSVASESTANIMINNTVLPIGVSALTEYETTNVSVKSKEEEAKQFFNNALLLYEVFEKGESTLVSKKTKYKQSESDYLCQCDYVFNENIAKTVEFSVTD